ncbi:TetR/AcrR family transcriptional regulator [Actinoplanes awajinensis]|uniref:TetR family transcriptional regulator n=1 Tax=Actinoplanes awajinensis subsp. mycoplanecinus TaxID=135947 RepID=A0A117MLA5_9ACTN|nr:TetR-like C-terminal domain-containing protein [Actinoplanes awajinensis]KUL23682.1 TetR family transcriptional regulator [Actinoplanes awajinensis subsp. mycoplanecinus]
MGRPRTNDDAVKDRLVQTATEMLATRPRESLSIRALAAAAGTATAAVYTLFGSKDALIGEVRTRAVSGLFAFLSAVPASSDPLADVSALAEGYRRWALGHPHLYAVLFGGLQSFDPSGTAGTGDPIGLLLDAINRGRVASVLAGDPADIALSLWVALHGLVTLELAGALDSATADRTFASTVPATLRGWACSEV